MDMEEDATILSADEFKKQHGKKHIYIWEEANGPETPPEKPKIKCHHKQILAFALTEDGCVVSQICVDCGEDVPGEVIG